MPAARTLLITGATGYIGAEIAQQLIERGHRCFLVVREESEERARALFGPALGDGRAGLLIGDITRPGCALASEAVQMLPAMDAAIHLAALPRFSGFDYATMRSINVDGAMNTYRLATAAGCRAFFHFSTAYVAGQYEAEFSEEHRDEGQTFRNDYERTKLEAEVALEAAAAADGVTLTILRPSLVVGDGAAGAGQGRGLFGIIDVAIWAQKKLEGHGEQAKRLEVSLPGRPDLETNLISLQAMTALFFRIFDDPAHWGGAYHLVNHEYTRIGEVKFALETLFGIGGVVMEGEPGYDPSDQPASPIAFVFRKKMKAFFPYFTSAPRWDRSRLERAIPDWRQVSEEALNGSFLEAALEGYGSDERQRRVQRYFSRFVPSHADDAAFNEVRSLNDTVGVRIDGAQPERRLVMFEKGRFRMAVSDFSDSPRCVFQLDLPTFEEIVGAEIAPQQAFFDKRVHISGDLLFALKLGSLLEGFFARHPYRRLEEASK